jgi:formate hydrogenlyase subunit 3/multisubunit Na+/H+ antiporter MnhD subunit
MPLVFLFGLVGVLGITGVPFFNGFASKALLFEGLGEVAHSNKIYVIARIMFIIVSGG